MSQYVEVLQKLDSKEEEGGYLLLCTAACVLVKPY